MNLKQELKKFVKRGQFELKGGDKSDVYLNLREAYGDPRILKQIVEELANLIPKETTCIAALGLGGISPSTLLSVKLGLKLILLRENIKDHGLQSFIEGYTPKKEDVVAIVDDIFTVGTSLKKSIEILKPTGAQIIGCYVVVKRGEANFPLPLHYLYTLDDLL